MVICMALLPLLAMWNCTCLPALLLLSEKVVLELLALPLCIGFCIFMVVVLFVVTGLIISLTCMGVKSCGAPVLPDLPLMVLAGILDRDTVVPDTLIPEPAPID